MSFLSTIRKELETTIHSLSLAHRRIFYTLSGVLALIVLVMLSTLNQHFMVSIPTRGGTLDEGIVGTPRFGNPVLATTDADRDLTTLVYAGLMHRDASGTLVPELAASYTISPDSKTYTFTLKKGLRFHDGTPLTSDDVAFTIAKINDPLVKSPLKVAWEGVSVATPDASTVVFTLKQPFGFFLDNTTVGILPAHIWSTIRSDEFTLSSYNTEPVGAGPYTISSVTRSAGIPTEFSLKAFSHYTLTRPYISTINLHVFANEHDVADAWRSGSINAVGGMSPETLIALGTEGDEVSATPLPRVYSLFLNQKNVPAFTDIRVRKALDLLIDKEAIVNDDLHGYAAIASTLMPEDTTMTIRPDATARIATAMNMFKAAGFAPDANGTLVHKNGKTLQKLAFTLATSDTPELKAIANRIAATLSIHGISVTVTVYEIGTLHEDTIRPRKFDALLFGQVITSPADLYAFWDSSERTDPGLNIGGYVNPKVDTALETIIKTTDESKRDAAYTTIASELSKDEPAIPLYRPLYVYLHSSDIRGITIQNMEVAQDRFANIPTWYQLTDHVWKLFTKQSD
jgi:peptide/nickel transport system substrate-binding protein